MKYISTCCIYVSILLTCTGCVSSSINESLALIEKENSIYNDTTVNKGVLTQIQALREFHHKKKSHTFIYELHTKELSIKDKVTLSRIISSQASNFTINIAPAKGNNSFQQLALSIERAKVLQNYIDHFNKKVVINFSPKLTSDTINLITGV